MNFETTTELKPYQALGVSKLMPIRVGALFMDMGTGKTRTAIELVHRRQLKIDKVVYFCPVSIKETIYREILKQTRSKSIHVFDDKTKAINIPKAIWYIIGIESMSLSKRVIFAANSLVTEKTMVIVDESEYIKGHYASRTRWITQISERAKYRLILTGTPISQGIVDLFAQMRFLSPKILGYNSFYSFARNHLVYSEKFPGKIERVLNPDYIAAKIQPYVYQVTKKECLDLPKKLYETRYCAMTGHQRYTYDSIKDEILSEMDYDNNWDSVSIFKLFTKLQQVVSGYEKIGKTIVDLENNRPEMLLDIVKSIPGNEQVIIWGKYHYDIKSISDILLTEYHENDIAYFHGKIKKRNNQIDRFKSGAKFFLSTQASGSRGLNELVSARYVIFYTNNFKYSERIQAEDRSHRIGQARNVTYIDIVCSDSIDERIDMSLCEKGNVVDAFKREVDKVKKQKGKGLKELVMKL